MDKTDEQILIEKIGELEIENRKLREELIAYKEIVAHPFRTASHISKENHEERS